MDQSCNLGEENGRKDICLICCSKDSNSNWNREEDKLSQQLNVIFILSKLLKVPSSNLEYYLKECGNPDRWITLCTQCSQLASRARDLHYQTLVISQTIKQIQLEFVESIKKRDVSDVKDENYIVRPQLRRTRQRIYEETRHFVKTDGYHNTLEDPFVEGDRLAKSMNKRLVNNNKNTSTSPAPPIIKAYGKTSVTAAPTIKVYGKKSVTENRTNDVDIALAVEVKPKVMLNDKSIFEDSDALSSDEADDRMSNDNWQMDDGNSDEDWEPSGTNNLRHKSNTDSKSKRSQGRKLCDGVLLSEMGEFRRMFVRRTLFGERIRAKKRHGYSVLELDELDKIALKYNIEKDKLFVGDIEIWINEQEKCLECSQCQFKVIVEKGSGRGCANRKMQDHVGGIHLNAFTCHICDVQKKSQSRYKEHMASHRDQYKCEICGRAMKDQSCLKIHKWSHKSQQEKEEAIANGEPNHDWRRWRPKEGTTFQCSVCGKVFRSRSTLKSHEYTHLGKDRPMTICSLCGQTVLQKYFNYHWQRCKPKNEETAHRIKCLHPECEETFLIVKDMRLHYKKHHGSKNAHVCHVCGKGFPIKAYLATHAKTHSDERPFGCSKGCHVAFKNRFNAIRHSKTCKGKLGTCPKFSTERGFTQN